MYKADCGCPATEDSTSMKGFTIVQHTKECLEWYGRFPTLSSIRYAVARLEERLNQCQFDKRLGDDKIHLLSEEVKSYRYRYGCLSCGENHPKESMCPPVEVRTTGMAWCNAVAERIIKELRTKVEKLKEENEKSYMRGHRDGRKREQEGGMN